MFDLFLTLLHVTLVSGIILVSALVLKRSRARRKDPTRAAKESAAR